jgi:hypothetical protein
VFPLPGQSATIFCLCALLVVGASADETERRLQVQQLLYEHDILGSHLDAGKYGPGVQRRFENVVNSQTIRDEASLERAQLEVLKYQFVIQDAGTETGRFGPVVARRFYLWLRGQRDEGAKKCHAILRGKGGNGPTSK